MQLDTVSLNHIKPLETYQLLDEIHNITFDTRDVLIVIDDFTRPRTSIARMVVEYAVNKVGEDKVAVVVASGLHRANTHHEVSDKIGSDLTKRLKIYSHSPLCNFPLNKKKYNIIGVGCVLPHTYVGLSGDCKIVLPGLSGYQDVMEFHGSVTEAERGFYQGTRERIETYVNYSINCYGDPVRISIYKASLHARHFRCSAINDYSVILPDPTDVAILVPIIKNKDFLQSMNAMCVFMEHTQVKDGGIICIWSDCPEGIGVHYGFQQPNGLRPAFFDDVFSEQYNNRQICFVCPSVSEEAIQVYFHREIFNFPNIADFLQFVNLRLGRAAEAVIYYGSDIMLGEYK